MSASPRSTSDPGREQRRAADPAASVWVSASAGSGKTKVLTDRVLNLMLDGTPPEKILCLTFTKAAAAEMANRVNETLEVWAISDDPGLAEALAGLTDQAADEDRLRHARRLFARVLDAPGGLKIQTIHSFCESLLKRFPLEAALAPHFEVMDDRSAAELLQAARDAVLARAARDRGLAASLANVTGHIQEETFAKLMGILARERGRLQRIVAEHGDAVGAAAAVDRLLGLDPGTTEADVLREASRNGAFDRAGLKRAADALLTSKSAGDRGKGQRVADWLAAGIDDRVRDFDLYCSTYLTQKGEPLKTPATKPALEEDPALGGVLAVEADRLIAALERRRAAITARATAGLLHLGAALAEEYRRAKDALARLDYDDLIYKAQALLAKAGAAWVLYKLDGGIDHILIDESQDTNPEQWDVVKALAAEFFAGEGAHEGERTVFAVGDSKQSIFSFQRADPKAAEDMRRHFAERVPAAGKDWREVPIDISFRSTDAVLRAVDATFAAPPARDGVVEPGGELHHRAHRAGHAGRVELWPLAEPRARAEGEPWLLPTGILEKDDPATRLAHGIAARIEGWIGNELLPARARPVRAGDIMVLVRRRTGFFEELVRALKDRKVAVAGVDRMVLTDQLAVMDLVAVAQFLLLPGDDLNLAVVLKGPFLGLHDDDLFRLAHDRGTDSLWRRLQAAARDERHYAAAAAWLADLLARVDFTPPYELFAGLLAAPTPAGETGRQRMAARLGREADDPIDEFLALALGYERVNAPSLQGFLHWVAAGETEIKRDLEQTGRDEVRILTVHGAKGLQAPIVILPDTTSKPAFRTGLTPMVLWSGDLPLWPPRTAHESERAKKMRAAAEVLQDEEYRRLLYVAMTRAEDRLYIGGWRGPREPAADCWYEMVRTGLGAVAEPAEFDFADVLGAEGWSGDGLRLDGVQEAMPETGAPIGTAELAEAEPERWMLEAAPEDPAPPRPLAPSRPGDEEPAVRSPMAPDTAPRFRRGLLVHRLLQTLPDLAPESRRAAAERFLARPIHDLKRREQAALADEVMAVMAAPEFAAIFGPGSRAEAPLIGVVGDAQVVSGQVDRLLVGRDSVLVVDYKTMRPAPAGPEDVPDIYLRQMAAYRRVLDQIWPDRPVRCALLWTEVPALMALDDGLLDRFDNAP